MHRLADIIHVGHLPAFVDDDSGFGDESLDLVQQLDVQISYFLFLLGENGVVDGLALLTIARLCPCGCVRAAIVDPDDLLKVLGHHFERATVGGVRIQNVLDDLLEVEDVDFVVLPENGERPREVVLALDFLGGDVSEQFEVDALVDVSLLGRVVAFLVAAIRLLELL